MKDMDAFYKKHGCLLEKSWLLHFTNHGSFCDGSQGEHVDSHGDVDWRP